MHRRLGPEAAQKKDDQLVSPGSEGLDVHGFRWTHLGDARQRGGKFGEFWSPHRLDVGLEGVMDVELLLMARGQIPIGRREGGRSHRSPSYEHNGEL